jgi:hypothetical protein
LSGRGRVEAGEVSSEIWRKDLEIQEGEVGEGEVVGRRGWRRLTEQQHLL